MDYEKDKDYAYRTPAGEVDNRHDVSPPDQYRDDGDVFGDEANADIHYKTLSWQFVSMMMIAEIVSNGMLSLPSSLAVVGVVPGVIIIIFLGVFATFTSYLLIQFKVRHPEVHSMGDAGYIIAGPIGREVLAGGTVIFAICGTGSQLLAGQIALGALSSPGSLCLLLYTGIMAIPTFFLSLPRTLDRLNWLSALAAFSILIAGIVGMGAAGANPITDQGSISIALSSDFTSAFISITNPVFAYAGHFMFFILISEMANPQDAMKAAYTLQGFATIFYTVFAIVTYYYLGPSVTSPSFSSLPPIWQKATYGLALPNFLIAGCLYSHTAAKLLFVRIFRHSRHLHSHTLIGWTAWTALVFLMVAIAFILAVGVPIFNYLVGLSAALFASWYTYGVAGAFWIHDTWIGWESGHRGTGEKSTWMHARPGFLGTGYGWSALMRRKGMFALCVGTVLGGAFICVAGLYAIIEGIIEAYATGAVATPFSCSAG
ncbi:hypothetical protein MMC10_009569 [Thelotrema lepadinum]|nr:hypothetical protein [Thelotrema lepadinum]